jgi:hypothetical protein
MKSVMEKLLGSRIGFDKVIPGFIVPQGQVVVYFSDDGKSDFKCQFRRLTEGVNPSNVKCGGMTSQGCRLWLPDGALFHPVSYHGDVDGWAKTIELAAKQWGFLLARIDGTSISISDGRLFPLADCKVEFDEK